MIVLALWIVCTAFVLILVFTALGMPFAAAWALVSPRKQRFCLQCHSTDALRWPYVCKVCRSKKTISAAAPIAAEFAVHSTEMPICTQCGSCSEEGTRFCGNCGAPVSAAVIPNPPVGTGAPPLPVLPKPGISRRILKFIAYGSAIAAAIFILFAIFAIVFPAPSNQSGGFQPSASQATPPQDNASQTPQAADSEAAPTPEEAEENKQAELGWNAMVGAMRLTPDAFNEKQNLRFDSVIVMPDGAVCLSVHDANPRTAEIGVEEPSAFVSMPGGHVEFAVMGDGEFVWFEQQCIYQQGGVDVLPHINAASNDLERKLNDYAQRLKGSQQETSGSPSAPQATEVTQGQTPNQVVAILGPPISITTGAKHVYTYPHVMIVFTDGKVSEIHQIQ